MPRVGNEYHFKIDGNPYVMPWNKPQDPTDDDLINFTKKASPTTQAQPSNTSDSNQDSFFGGLLKPVKKIYDQVAEAGKAGAAHIKEGNYPAALHDIAAPVIDPFSSGIVNAFKSRFGSSETAPTTKTQNALGGLDTTGLPASDMYNDYKAGNYKTLLGEGLTGAAMLAAPHLVKGISGAADNALNEFARNKNYVDSQRVAPVQGPVPDSYVPMKPQPAVMMPNRLLPESTGVVYPKPDFFSGPAGVTDASKTYPMDLGPVKPPITGSKELGTILPRETEGKVDLPAIEAARLGTTVGKPATYKSDLDVFNESKLPRKYQDINLQDVEKPQNYDSQPLSQSDLDAAAATKKALDARKNKFVPPTPEPTPEPVKVETPKVETKPVVDTKEPPPLDNTKFKKYFEQNGIKNIYDDWVNQRHRAANVDAYDAQKLFKDKDAESSQDIGKFQDAMEAGMHPDVTKFNADLLAKEQAAGVPVTEKPNYLRQEWQPTTPEQETQIRKTLNLDPSISLESQYKNYSQGIAAGRTPKSQNISDIMASRAYQSGKAIADATFIKRLKDAGFAKEEPAPGLKKVPGTDGEVFAPPQIVDAMKNMLDPADPWLTKVGNVAGKIAGAGLSAGLPRPKIGGSILGIAEPSGMGFHGVNLANMKGKTTSLKGGGYFGGVAKAIPELVNTDNAVANLDSLWHTAGDAVNHGVMINRNADYMGEPLISSKDLIPGKNKVTNAANSILNGGIKTLNKVSEFGTDTFWKPLATKIIPSFKLKAWNDLYPDLIKKGMSEYDAKKAAAEHVNNAFGELNYDQLMRGKNFQMAMRAFNLAPGWLESRLNMGKGEIQSLIKPGSPEGTMYRRALLGTATAGLATSVGNMLMGTGTDPLELQTGKTDSKDKSISISPQGTSSPVESIPIGLLYNFLTGTKEKALPDSKNYLNPAAKTAINLIATHEDNQGNKLWGTDKYGNNIPKSKAALNVANEFTNLGPRVIKDFSDYIQGKNSLLQTGLSMTGAPVRFRSNGKQRTVRSPFDSPGNVKSPF